MLKKSLIFISLFFLLFAGLVIASDDIFDVLKSGDTVKARELIEENPDLVYKKDKFNSETLLHIAAYKGYTEIAELLIEKGADVNAEKVDGWTPLDTASYCGNKEMVELLIENGADVNAKTEDGWTPLHHAASSGSKEVVFLLIEKGADVNAKTEDGLTPLHCVGGVYSEDIVELFIEKGADINAKTEDGLTPLYFQVEKGSKEVVSLLIEKGADINVLSGEFSLLQIATFLGDRDIAEILIENGLDVNSAVYYETFGETTPLHMAVMEGYLELVELFINKGALIDAKDELGGTPINWAVFIGNDEMVDILKKYGATNDGYEEFEGKINETFSGNSELFEKCASNLKMIATALEMYAIDYGDYPTSLDYLIKPYPSSGAYLKVLVSCPACKAKYIYEKKDSRYYLLQCGKENAHINTGEVGEGYYPKYTPCDGIVMDGEVTSPEY